MDRAKVDEKLKALEAALSLAARRNLPALRDPRAEMVDPAGASRSRQEVLTAALLKNMETRVSRLEQSASAISSQQAVAETMHHEERQAIELIGREVASLKARADAAETRLGELSRPSQTADDPCDSPGFPGYPTARRRRSEAALMVALILLVGLIALALLLFRSF